ncbi:pirin family protein [Hydrogenophaga palleronii]|uniref:pirin family protein n=1 Tax=Hydrogenophaga palleronii TaxID=65655 RepID=UPI00082448CD|nr:pirin family protein [Hydrogenophaga palleronii]
MNDTPTILENVPMNRPWTGVDPFLFCMYHTDQYPPGNGRLGIDAGALQGRPLGSDFSGENGYSMYHGEMVPGFPSHPHRGFETVTIVRQGYVDHADSLGAKARYGVGDVQWLTAGAGVQHAEMFPLLHTDRDNPLELFQIWLNLPARSKFAPPAFKMLWAEDIPHYTEDGVEVTVIAGAYRPVNGRAALQPVSPPPDSWGAQAASDLALWLLHLQPGASLELPAANSAQALRTLYVFEGDGLSVGGEAVGGERIVRITTNVTTRLSNAGHGNVQVLLMQGVPLNEPVAAAGPFVMNTQAELHQARVDYMRTRFGGWPWDTPAPTHGAGLERFALYPGQDAPERPPAKA